MGGMVSGGSNFAQVKKSNPLIPGNDKSKTIRVGLGYFFFVLIFANSTQVKNGIPCERNGDYLAGRTRLSYRNPKQFNIVQVIFDLQNDTIHGSERVLVDKILSRTRVAFFPPCERPAHSDFTACPDQWGVDPK